MQLIVRIVCGCRWCTENWRLKIWSSKGTVLLIHPQLHMKYSYGQNVFITHKSICRDLRSLFKALHVQHYVIHVQSAQSVNKNDKDASLTTEAAEHLHTRKTINKRQSLHPNKHTPVIQEQHCTANNKYSFVFSFRHTTRRVFSVCNTMQVE